MGKQEGFRFICSAKGVEQIIGVQVGGTAGSYKTWYNYFNDDTDRLSIMTLRSRA